MANELNRNKILATMLQKTLQGSEFVLLRSIWDLSGQAEQGMDRITIPRYNLNNAGDIVTGTAPAGTDGAYQFDQLIFDQFKRVHTYVDHKLKMQERTNLEAGFVAQAPKDMATLIESSIGAVIAAAGPHDFNSGTANSFGIEDIAKAKKLLDQARVPKQDRYIAVSSAGMEVLSGLQAFEDASRSLSAEALREGVVGRVKGFWVIETEDVADDKVHCFHRQAVAFGLQGDPIKFGKETDLKKHQDYLEVISYYGAKVLNGGKLKVTITMAA